MSIFYEWLNALKSDEQLAKEAEEKEKERIASAEEFDKLVQFHIDRENAIRNQKFNYVYFVSWSHDLGRGNSVITLESPISRKEDVRSIEIFIRNETRFNRITVSNFILLRTEEQHHDK